MSVDTVNEALTTVRIRIQRNPSSYSEDSRRLLIAMCEVMRDFLMAEDVAGFNQYVNSELGGLPDAMPYLLDDLFAELGFPDGMRHQLDAELSA